jgi:acetyltransferase-like isoleucine patch superfamily enzyme
MDRTESVSSTTYLNFKKRGKEVQIRPLAKIIAPEQIEIGDRVNIDDFTFISGIGGLDIGSFIHIAPYAYIAGGGHVMLGDFSSYSAGVRILSGTDEPMTPALVGSTIPAEFRNVTRTNVYVGPLAFVGLNAVIMPGVAIGEGAVIGACSLVMGDCEPWTVYVGQPARPIKMRPNKKEILAMATDCLRRYR